MDNKFEPLSQEDVVCVESEYILMSHGTFKVSEFMKKIQVKLSLQNEERNKWLRDGQACEILQPGSSGWQKGKIRISLEFCPEEPKPLSPLDGIEQQADGFNS